MPRKRTAVAAGAAALLAIGGGALARVSAQPTQATPDGARYHVSIPEDATAAQREAVESMLYDRPIPVQDQEGIRRGYVRDSALTERDARVNEQILDGFRAYNGGEDPEYDELYEALRVLDPVPVVDEAGTTVGYFTRRFQTAEQIEAATPQAEALVDQKIG